MFASPPLELSVSNQLTNIMWGDLAIISYHNNDYTNNSTTYHCNNICNEYSLVLSSTSPSNYISDSNNRRSMFSNRFKDSLPLPHNLLLSNKERNFINTPLDYTIKTRNEVEQSIISQNTNLSKQSVSNQLINSNDISSYQISIFTKPSIQSNPSYSNESSSMSISLPPLHFVNKISLLEALPKTYQDMYSVGILSTSALLPNGRPRFTQRALIDWELNDIRSLLIVEKIKPEWGNSIPVIVAPNYDVQLRIILLPLTSSENEIIETLVSSDIYMEAGLDLEFKRTIAKCVVDQVKKKHYELNGIIYSNTGNVLKLTKVEWRNIIENYLLNIGVEVQCRHDFRKRCSNFRKWKVDNMIKSCTNSNNEEYKIKVVLTKEEKSILWSQCQAQVYQRIGLDWQPNEI